MLAVSIAAAVALRLLRTSTPTLDTWAFMDWGRDLLHGNGLGMENRTFHPLPIVFGAAVSLAGPSAPPLAVLASLSSLALLAIAVGRAVTLLGGGWPAAALGVVAVMANPLLNDLAYITYVNLPFATMVTWALVAELEAPPRRRWSWALLIAAGLVRPEGWAFLAAYAVWLGWRRSGRERWRLAALAAAPMVVWLALEAALFQNPLYSFLSTRPAGGPNDTASPDHWFDVIHFALPWSLLAALAVGLVAVLLPTLRPRRPADVPDSRAADVPDSRAADVPDSSPTGCRRASGQSVPQRRGEVAVAAMAVALFSTILLAPIGFNVPSRHFSTFVALALVVAATGSSVPARLAGHGRWRTPLALLGVAVVALPAVKPVVDGLRAAEGSVKVKYETDRDLVRLGDATRAGLGLERCPTHLIANLGVLRTAEVAWAFDVKFDCVDDLVGPATRVVVRPTRSAYHDMLRVDLSDRPNRGLVPDGYRLVGANASWEVYKKAPR